MKIIFLCLGSRGDVQPYVAIGKTAQAKGHTVTICTGKTFEPFVRENGLGFEPCSLDLMAILQTEEGKQIFEEGFKHPIKAMTYSKSVVNPLYRKAMTEFYKACESKDVIIFHPKAFGAVDIADKLGILCISMPPIPIIYPIPDFPNLAITTKNLGSLLNKMTYTLVNKSAESNNINDINDFRETELGLGKRKMGVFTTQRNGTPLPIIYPISPVLFSTVQAFKENVYLTGFPMLEEATRLDEETEVFLKGDQPPIVITFSSMPLKDSKRFLDRLSEALRLSGNRGIIISGNSGINMSSQQHLLVKAFLPHDVVFKQSKGILHHGGVGTMAAALRSGRPQVMMPFNVDQPFWAKKLFELGYSLSPLKESDTIEAFVEAFKKMENDEVIRKSAEIAASLSLENPNTLAVELIENLFKEWTQRNG